METVGCGARVLIRKFGSSVGMGVAVEGAEEKFWEAETSVGWERAAPVGVQGIG